MKKNKKSIWGVEIKYPGYKQKPIGIGRDLWSKQDAEEFMQDLVRSKFEEHNEYYKNDRATWNS